MITEIVTSAAAIYGIYVAHMGLQTWRREAIGKRDVVLCEDVMARFYEAESRLRDLRSPAVWAGEGATRPNRTEDDSEEKVRRDILFAPIERFEKQLPFWRELLAYRFKMKAFVPGDSSALFDRLDLLLRKYRSAASVRYRSEFPMAGSLNEATLKEFDSILFEWGEADQTRDEMSNIVKGMEAICLPHVRMTVAPFATPLERLSKSVAMRLTSRHE